MDTALTKTVLRDFKKIGLFGCGRSSLSLIKRLSGKDITLRSEEKIARAVICSLPSGVRVLDGERAFDEVCEDVLVLSPSVRRERAEFKKFLTRGTVFTSDAELFFELNCAPLYAVSGSDGKSTTVSIAARLLGERYGNVCPVGNIGVPFLDSIDKGYGAYAAEISSFTLHYFAPRSTRALLTSLTPNHLDWHASLDEYIEAKIAVFRNTGGGIINFDDEMIRKFAPRESACCVISTERKYAELKALFPRCDLFTADGGMITKNGEALFPLAALRRREDYNVRNMLLALALTDGCWSVGGARAVAESFSGLAHRGEVVAESGGVRFIDSSIDTTPSRTAATVAALGQVCVVILGGRGKGVSHEPLLAVADKMRAAVVCGESANDVEDLLCGRVMTVRADGMEDAIITAMGLARSGDAILLSPAATSFDRYGSYEERGEHFASLVRGLVYKDKET